MTLATSCLKAAVVDCIASSGTKESAKAKISRRVSRTWARASFYQHPDFGFNRLVHKFIGSVEKCPRVHGLGINSCGIVQ